MIGAWAYLLPLAQQGAVQKLLTVEPAVSLWVLVPGMILVVALIVYLYRAQRQIAAPRLVGALTVIRVLLIVLVFALLLRPLWVWTHTQRSPETLWVLVDQSLSMAQTDPQSTAIERLRWANALGDLPANLHSAQLDRAAARLVALRADLLDLQHQAQGATEGANAADRQRAGVESLNGWNNRLKDVADALARDSHLQSGDGPEILKTLAEAQSASSKAVAQAASVGNPRPAGLEFPWSRVEAVLETTAARIRPIGEKADEDLLHQHGGDAALRDAMAKVSRLRRADLAYGALTHPENSAGITLRKVLDRQRTRILAFGSTQRIVPTDDKGQIPSALTTAIEPAGSATDLEGALRFVNDQIADGEQASVLVVSDGRADAGGDAADPARQLASRGVRVFALAVGSNHLATDAAVESVEAPDWIYKDDTLRASAVIRLDGMAGKPVKVELRRAGNLVETKTVTASSGSSTQILTFTDKPPEPGVYSYEIGVVPVAGEAVEDNNRQSFRVSVKKDKFHALIIEDQPRWEYRYLANYLKRDPRVHIQSVLLEAARIDKIAPPPPVKASPTNDRDDAQILPQSVEEWSAFDMIALGDIPPEYLAPDAQKNIAKAVKDRGTTLVVIAGPLNMPVRYSGTPLAEVLPVELSSNWSSTALADHLRNGFRPTIAPEGSASVLSQFGLDEQSNARFWSELPHWFWHSEQTQAKPSASVLWQIADLRTPENTEDSLTAARQRALLATMPLGLGRVLYLASDSTWRLRQVGGENLHERFWGQVIRWAAGSDMPAGGKFVRFGTDKSRYVAGDTVHVSARVFKQDFTPLTGQRLKVIARAPGDQSAGAQAEAELQDSPETPGLYHGDLKNIPAGASELSLEGAGIQDLLNADPYATQKTLQIDMLSQANVEHQNVNPDRATLARVAREGNGIALDAEDADVLAEHIPNVERELTSTQQFGLFADPGARYTRIAHWGFLTLFVTLITAEWLLRKTGGLV